MVLLIGCGLAIPVLTFFTSLLQADVASFAVHKDLFLARCRGEDRPTDGRWKDTADAMVVTADRRVRRRATATLIPCRPRQTASSVYLGKSDEPCLPMMTDSPNLTYPQQTPHSGRHFLPSHPGYTRKRRRSSWMWWLRRRWHHRERFMEGWYYRLTLPTERISFAFIISIEDPGRAPPSDLRLACIQVVGPNDGYLVQADRDDSKFWAWKHVQGLGCVFSFQPTREGASQSAMPSFPNEQHRMYHPPDALNELVESGFQIVLPWHFWGRIRGHDGTLGGVFEGQGVPGYCAFDFSVQPLCGWGGALSSQQKSTGGWLASFRVFEPHWQVTMADGRATGSVTWKNQVYNFTNAPFYAEKNWGAALPRKWYWTQCNSFDGYDQLSVTAGGGIRLLPFGRQERLGMISIHYDGRFYEGVPWSGSMEWVAKWGYWELRGNSTYGERPFEAVITYVCDPLQTPGLVFRAPTPDEGMKYFCRDTFDAKVNLTLWELEWDRAQKRYKRKPGPPLIDDATSQQGGAEIGGGPWWDEWKGVSKVKQPIKALLQLPTRIASIPQKLIVKTTM